MLRRLQMKEFLCFANAEVHFDRPVTLFTGDHGTGKTAVLDAIRFAITGLARGIEQKNQMAELIRDGAESTTVELELGRVAISRTIKRSGGEKLAAVIDGQDVPGTFSEVQAAIYGALGLHPLSAPVVLDAWRFLDLSTTDRKALLWRAIEATITADAIRERLDARGIDGDLDVLARDTLEVGFDAARKLQVELRRQAKRELDELQPPPNFETYIIEGKPYSLADMDLADQERNLVTRRHELEEAIANQGADRGKIEGQLEQHRATKAKLEAELHELDTDPAVPADQLKAAHTEASKDYDRMGAALATLREKASKLVDRGAGGGPVEIEYPGVCPVVAGEFTCPATARKLELHAEKLTQQQATAREAFAKLEPELAAKEAQHAEAQRKRDTLAAELAAAQERERQREALTLQLGQANDSITALEESLTTASVDGDSTSVEDLRKRVETGTNLIEALRQYTAQTVRAAADAQRKVELVAARDRHDALDKAFAPDGIPSELAKAALGPIRERLAQTGQLLGDVTLTDEFVLTVRRNGQHRTERQLSRSERLRLGIAVQDALASMAPGWPLLIVDEVDVFNPRTRPRVMDQLVQLASHPYASVVALATMQKEVPPPFPDPRGAAYWTHDGVIDRVTGSQAAA